MNSTFITLLEAVSVLALTVYWNRACMLVSNSVHGDLWRDILQQIAFLENTMNFIANFSLVFISVIVPTSSACRDLLLIQQLNKQQFSACGACRH